jgi:hypothetical protein
MGHVADDHLNCAWRKSVGFSILALRRMLGPSTGSSLLGGWGVTLATDLNGDGTPDIVVGTLSGAVQVFVNECR